jgi:hypothetical protein
MATTIMPPSFPAEVVEDSEGVLEIEFSRRKGA